MTAQSCDALTRHALQNAPANRRAALLAFAAAGALGLADPFSAEAKKRKKRRKKNKKNPRDLAAQQCQTQVDQCILFAAATCGDNQQCHDNAPLCCPFLGECAITEFLGCVAANS